MNQYQRYNIFVACPYGLYEIRGLRDVFEELGRRYPVDFVFADETIDSSQVWEKVCSMIQSADYVLCDITLWNPNVTLELGYAMGKEKEFLILFNAREKGSIFSKARKDLPTDLKGRCQVLYANKKSLEEELSRWLNQLERREKSVSDSTLSPRDRILLLLRRHHEGLYTKDITRYISEPHHLTLATLQDLEGKRLISRSGGRRYTKWIAAPQQA